MSTLKRLSLSLALLPLPLFAQSDWTAIDDDATPVPSLGVTIAELEGLPVMTETGERVGALGDAMIEPGSDVVAFTLDVGEYLGLDDKNVLVPVEGMRLFAGEVITDLTREEFTRMPGFDG